MKDLYRKLSVPSTSSDAQIRAALTDKRSKLSAEDAKDIECVLLDNLRRKKHDHVYRTVQCIVNLRSQIHIKESSGQERANLRGFAASVQQKPKAGAVAKPKQDDAGWGGCLITIIIFGGLWLAAQWSTKEHAKPEVPDLRISPGNMPSVNDSDQTYTFPSQPAIEPGVLATPATGVMEVYDYRKSVAPLEIRTRDGSGNYYVKISSIIGERLILSKTAFIRDGETLNTTMPIGDFEIRYAVGKNWYGTKRFFGKSTSYAKADDVFSFRETLQGYSGFTVELYRQVNGNLETEPLSADEF